MPPAAALTKSKLMTYLQCPRRLWLEQYRPELEEESSDAELAMETGRVVADMAREVYGCDGGQRIGFERGLRSAVERTVETLSAGGKDPLFEAAFDFDGVTVLADVLDRATLPPRLLEVKSSTSVKDHHVDDCAIQAWTIGRLGYELSSVSVAHVDDEFVYQGDDDYSRLFVEEDLTAAVGARLGAVQTWVDGARETLASLDEPETPIGEQCDSPYECPFFSHCRPEQGRYPVEGLGGRRDQIFEWIRAGHRDIRDVPEEELLNERQRRIWQQTQRQEAYVGPGLAELIWSLEHPRFFLDFETIAFAIPVWRDTQPYEALPFQWSCHIDRGNGAGAEHTKFLDLSGEPPMRACADRLIDALGGTGPILTYSSYEKQVIGSLVRRFPDLREALEAIADRLVDLYPVTKANYYHPDMLGSWSLKAVLPTIGTTLDYGDLGEVRQGFEARAAYVEAIDPATSDERREALSSALSEYCRYDTLALVELVDFFSRSAL
jgi:hypothetical protein